jgi:hypothetical protein
MKAPPMSFGQRGWEIVCGSLNSSAASTTMIAARRMKKLTKSHEASLDLPGGVSNISGSAQKPQCDSDTPGLGAGGGGSRLPTWWGPRVSRGGGAAIGTRLSFRKLSLV